MTCLVSRNMTNDKELMKENTESGDVQRTTWIRITEFYCCYTSKVNELQLKWKILQMVLVEISYALEVGGGDIPDY